MVLVCCLYIFIVVYVYTVYCLVIYVYVCILVIVLVICAMELLTSIEVEVFRNTFLFCFCSFGEVFSVVLWSIGVFVEFSLSSLNRLCRWMNLLYQGYPRIQGRLWFW